MRRLLRGIAAVLPALWISSAAALGLGEIDVRSRLNQRFAATIPIDAASGDDLETLKVALASNAEFERAGVERLSYLSTLRFVVKTDGAPRIEVTSDQVAREPFLTLLLDVRQAGSRLVREYTVFLDPPEYRAPESSGSEFYETAAEKSGSRPAATPEPAPTYEQTEPVVTPEPAAEQPLAERPTSPVAEPAQAEAGSYGPVQGQETLWSIATRLRPSGATMDQILLAIYRSNPAAFDGGINGLRKGSMLTVPSADQVLSVDPQSAREEVMALRGKRISARSAASPPTEMAAVASTPPPRPTPRPTAVPTAVPTPEPTPEPTPQPTPEPTPEPTLEPTPVPTAAPAESSVEGGAAAVIEATPAPASEIVAATPAPTAAPADEIVVEKPIRKEAEPGLLETLLIPLVGGLIILGGIGYLISRLLARRKNGAPESERALPPKAPVAPKVAAKPAAPPPPPPPPPPPADVPAQRADTAKFEAGQLKTQPIAPQKIASAPPEPPAADKVTTETVDFDLTGQFESQTVQINLDANDPVSEADFHLAYGLYDEAALLLKQAAEKEPQRSDVRVKLAETYFAAGKRAEFEQCAREMKAMLSVEDWQKIAIMGQQLAPDSDLFKGSGGAQVGSTDFDLDFGATSEVPAPAAVAEPKPDAGLDFKLEDLEVPSLDQPKLEVAADKGEALEFDLSQFDLAEPAPAPAAATGPKNDESNSLDFDLDLSGFDVAGASEVAASPPPQQQRAEPAPVPAAKTESPSDFGEIRLDDIDLGEFGGEPPTAGSDEVSTKLDLARAYVDMGDHDMARSLLDEVAQQGNAEQKQSAQALIAQLG